MSVRAMTWAYEQRVGDPTRKFILLILADHAGSENVCWPSLELLAEKCECSAKTVRRHIHDLAKRGLVEIKPRKRPNGTATSNWYRLAVPSQFGRGGAPADGRGNRTPSKNLATMKKGNTGGRGGYRGSAGAATAVWDDEVPE